MLHVILLVATLGAAPPSTPKPANNTVCPVLGEKTTSKSPTVTVRGQAYRICCAMCGPKLTADPDKYLEKDGSLKQAKKKG